MATFGTKKFRVLRGYRNEGALYDSLPFDPNNAAFEFGDPVKIDATGKVVKATDATGIVGFVVDDPDAPNTRAIKKVTVLFSNFIAETQKYNATATYQPGTEITIKNGVVDAVSYDPNTGQALDPIVGQVISVGPDRITFIVK